SGSPRTSRPPAIWRRATRHGASRRGYGGSRWRSSPDRGVAPLQGARRAAAGGERERVEPALTFATKARPAVAAGGLGADVPPRPTLCRRDSRRIVSPGDADESSMKAAVCRAFGEPLAVEEVELRAPGLGEVTVRVAACAICHSDIALMRGVWGGDLPAVYGHEAAGVVEEVGAGVLAVAPGDHVVVTLVRSCGRCPQCLRGQPALCERLPEFPLTRSSPLTGSDGSTIQQGVRTAAFAERVTVDASQVVRIDDDVPLEAASLLACGVATGVGAVTNAARVEVGSSVVVFGAGGVGLNVIQGAVLAGARAIVAVDLLDSKLEAALRFGATAT